MKTLAVVAMGAVAVAAGCATTSEEPKPLLKPTITYEDIDAGPAPAAAAAPTDGGQPAQTAQAAPPAPAAPADPFAGCLATQPQQGMAKLDCGQTDAVIVNVVGKLTPDQVDQNLVAYAKNFPADAKQEKFNREIGNKPAQGLRISGATYAATMVILPHGSKHTRIVACRIQDNTPFTRCQAMVDQLATLGIPPNVTGADQLPAYLVAREKPPKEPKEPSAPTATDGGAPAK